MQSEIQFLCDPELIIPSDAGAMDPCFWERASAWAGVDGLVLGPATFERFADLYYSLDDLFNNKSLSNDFHEILGRFASKISENPHASVRNEIASTELLSHYKPFRGELDNAELLEKDLRECQVPLAIGSEQKCWDYMVDRFKDRCGDAVTDVDLLWDPKTADMYAYRQRIKETFHTYTMLQSVAVRAFPNIAFSSVAWRHISSFKGEESSNVPTLYEHLCVLNDLAPMIWSKFSDSKVRIRQMGGLGVKCSAENSNTHSSANAMRRRTFVFREKEVVCEWHAKLLPDSNRIYFSIDGSRVFVGAMIDHLPTR